MREDPPPPLYWGEIRKGVYRKLRQNNVTHDEYDDDHHDDNDDVSTRATNIHLGRPDVAPRQGSSLGWLEATPPPPSPHISMLKNYAIVMY